MTERKKKKNLKSLIRFHSANKIDNHNRWRKKAKKKKKTKRKIIYRTSQNVRIISVFLESLLSDSFPSLGITVHLTSLGCLPTLDLLWEQMRFYYGPTPVCSCLKCPQLSELVCFLLWELSVFFYISHRHRVCLVDLVDLICSLYSLWEGFGSSFLVTLPLCFNCGLFPPLHMGLPLGVCS